MIRISKAFALALVVCIVFGAIACSKKSPNASNFRNAINHSFKTDRQLCLGSYFDFKFPSLGRDATLDALAAKGLVSKSVGNFNLPRFDVTEAGRATSTQIPAKTTLFGNGGTQFFCYGTREVDKIVNFTEPSNLAGQTFVTVTYTWKNAKPLPSWAADPALASVDQTLAALQGAHDSNPDNLKASANLILTNLGWRLPEDMDK
jgi:hypothetical protein